MVSNDIDKAVYKQWVTKIRESKLEQNAVKRKAGYRDIDDHGYIPWDEPLPYKVIPNHPNGSSYGMKSWGINFKAYLDVHPLYINPYSALAGCWISTIPWRGTARWKPEDEPTHLLPFHKKYNIRHTGIWEMNHINPDMKIGFDLGWGGLLEKIRYYRKFNHPEDTSFYDGEELLVIGVQDWIKRHVGKAIEMAEAESDPRVKQNLLKIAEINEWLINGAPRTFREACQFLAWFQSLDRMVDLGGALGQLDELLRPFYERDTEAGILDDEEAIWCIASLFFNDTHYSQIGGATPDGSDLTSKVSYLVLEAMHRLKIPVNIALRVHDKLDPKILRKSIEYTFEDGSGVAYSLSKGLDEGFAKNGYPIGLARMRAKVGCNWTALPGIEYCHQDVTRLCLIAPFELSFKELMADSSAPRTLDELWKRYCEHLQISVDVIKEGFDCHIERQADNSPEIVLNLFMHGPVERGLDVSAGGVDLYNLTCDGIGLATVADSFAALEQRVVEEKRLTWEELAKHLENDFAGAEDVRLMLKNIKRFGNGNTRADWWAKRISDLYTHMMIDTPTKNGFKVIPGLFSHGNIDSYGLNLGATPNGRHAGAPISHNANPDPGFVPGSGSALTAKANAVAFVQPGYGNSAPLQLDVDKALAKQSGGIENIEAIIKTHNAQGGTLINLNVISKEKILEAHSDPSKHPDLVVRVTGYSAFFQSLSPSYRQLIVDRMLSEE